MNLNKTITVVGIMAVAVLSASAATPTVSNVTAKQRYPWNGMVDITCTVSGISGTTNRLEFAVAAVDSGNVHDIPLFWVVRDGTNSVDRTVHTNGTYHLVWDSKVNFDNQICSNMVMRVNIVRERVQLWENGPYWATTNIGAKEPWEYGYYFWWGDTIGYSSANFGFYGAQTSGKDVATLQGEGWITADGVLAPGHDAAHVHWGGAWRMPTKRELMNLCWNCDWTWTIMNGVKGCVVRGRGNYASNSIFLPAAGFARESVLHDLGWDGYYWSSAPYSDDNGAACDLHFSSSSHTGNYYSYRYFGQPVRPLQGFIK